MRRLTILFLAFVLFLPVFGQNEEKYSLSTRLFLQEQSGKVNLNRRVPARDANGQEILTSKVRRDIAAAEMIDGVQCVPAFIRLDDNTDVSELEALGVIVRDKFVNGLINAFIPVDKIDEVAAIAKVRRIKVASRMRALTDQGRIKTNTDDVLKCSSDATSAGLSKAYDGAGVLMGITDSGIDFQHKAFKDKNDGYRAVGAYQVKIDSNGNVTSRTEYTQSTMSGATTDDASDHGTHTCSTAGGSSVIISGSSVTVTDNHAGATYGGMAPGSDLWLAGVGDLNDTDLSSSFRKIISYAEAHDNMPVVISNSWGSGWGPRDGSTDFADVVATYFGDNYPNRVCLFAASNDAGNTSTSAPGGTWFSGTASSGSPVGSIFNPANSSYGYDGYSAHLASAWGRSNTALRCNIYVLDSSGNIKASQTGLSGSSNGTAVSGLSTYFTGTLELISDSQNGKRGMHLYSSGSDNLKAKTSGYRLAVEFYPYSGSTTIDVWADGYNWFSADKTTSGHTWTRGSDDMSVSDEATIPNAISIGAYVSKTNWRDYNGSSHTANSGSLGDIADFSSYAVASASPTGEFYPWISAPGAQIVAAVNHLSTDYISGDSKSSRVNSNTTYPYGAMQGTSMATPTAAGIVALWLQVAKENNIELTTTDIKTIMKESAIKDSYTTTGSNHTHFGNGKIDALAGIEYILKNYASTDPVLFANPAAVTFNETVVNTSEAQTVAVTAKNLTAGITATLGGTNAAMFAINPSSLTTDGGDITVTYTPTAVGVHTATLTLSSNGAQDVVVNITGNSTFTKNLPVLTAATGVGDTQFTANWTDATDAQYVSSYDLQVNIDGSAEPVTIVSDELTRATTGMTSTNYSNWSGKTVSSSAVYAGNSAGGNDAIQLRSNNGNSGIVTTTSGGKIKKVTVAWNSSTTGRTLDVYGSNTAYSSAADLYGSSAGTKIGSISSDSGTQLEITGDYAYVGVRSNSGALYMDKITFDWQPTSANSAPRRAVEETGGTRNRTITGIEAKTYTVTDLLQGETYKYKVRAHYVDGVTSAWTDTKSVTLTGEKVLHPEIIADADAVNFGSVTTGSTATAIFSILADELKDDVTLTITGEDAVAFSVNLTTVAKANAQEGAEITVSFTPGEARAYSATLTIASTDAEPVVVTLTGTGLLLKQVPELTDATGVGTTSFTANWNTVPNAQSYTLFVNKSSSPIIAGNTFTLVTDAATLSAGDQVIIVDETAAVAAGPKHTNGSYLVAEGITISDSKIEPGSGVLVFTLEAGANSGTWKFNSDNGYLYSSAAKSLVTSSTASEATISISSGNATISFGSAGRILYNGGSPRFTTYATTTTPTSSNNMRFPQLYRKTAVASGAPRRLATETGDEDTRTITGIEAGTYTVENLTAGAIYQYKVKAVYTDNTESEWSEPRSQQLEEVVTPTLTVSPVSLAFDETYVDATATKTFTVTGAHLEGDVTVAVAGTAFSVSTATITKANAEAEAGATVTVTFAPTAVNNYSGTVTLTSTNATDVTVSLTGSAVKAPLVVYDPVMLNADAQYVTTTSFKAQWTDQTAAENVASYTLYVNKKAATPAGPTVLEEEDFSNNTWTTSSKGVVVETDYIRLGTSNDNGSVTSPEVTPTDSKLTVKVVAKYYDNDTGTNMKVSLVGTTKSETFALTNSDATYTAVFDVTANQSYQVKIENLANKKRVRLKSATIYSGDASASAAPRRVNTIGDADTDGLTVTGITAKEYTVENLTAGATYEYKVKAIYTDETESNLSAIKEVTLLETPPAPVSTLTVSPASLAFGEITEGETLTKTFTVTGSNLEGDVTVAAAGTGFTVSPATIAKADAEAGATVTVTFAPTAAGDYSGTVTLTSTGATDATVSLTGSAVAPTYDAPELAEQQSGDVGTSGFIARWTEMNDAVSYTLQVTKTGSAPVEPTTVSDVLTRESTGVTSGSTNYTDWSGVTDQSTAVYAGQSAGGNDAIQIRSKNSNSGIVTTASGGNIRKVTVVWESHTSSGRTLNVYGSNTAYKAPSELFVASSRGTLLGTIVMGTSTELEITGDYAFVGVCASDAMYLKSITFEWEPASANSAPRRAPVETGDETSRTITGITDTHYAVGGLEEEATFEYKVKAIYDDGESDWSEPKSVNLSTPTGIEMLRPGDGIDLKGRVLTGDAATRVFTIAGVELPARNGQWVLDAGIYVVLRDGKALKLIVR